MADLSEAEKTDLLRILGILHRFHKPVFEQAGEEELDRMLGKG